MKILLDESLTDITPLFRFIDYDVLTMADESFMTKNEENKIEFAGKRGYIFVTENEKNMKIAREKGIKYLFLDSVMKAKTIKIEIEKIVNTDLIKENDNDFNLGKKNNDVDKPINEVKYINNELKPQNEEVIYKIEDVVTENEYSNKLDEGAKPVNEITVPTYDAVESVTEEVASEDDTTNTIGEKVEIEGEYSKNFNEGLEAANEFSNLKISELDKLISNIEKGDKVAIRLKIRKEIVESIIDNIVKRDGFLSGLKNIVNIKKENESKKSRFKLKL